MGKGKGSRRSKRGGDLVVGSDGAKELSMEIVQLPNKKVDVVRGDRIVLLQIIKGRRGDEGRVVGRSHQRM